MIHGKLLQSAPWMTDLLRKRVSHAEEIFILQVDQGSYDPPGKEEDKLPSSCPFRFKTNVHKGHKTASTSILYFYLGFPKESSSNSPSRTFINSLKLLHLFHRIIINMGMHAPASKC